MAQTSLFAIEGFQDQEFYPQSRGRITWFDLSIHEKINMKSNYYFMSQNLPYSNGHSDAISYVRQHCLKYYVEHDITSTPDHDNKFHR